MNTSIWYERKTKTVKEEVFIAKICSWILNVCPFEEYDWKYYSIPFIESTQNPELKVAEIIADMSLFSLLFETTNGCDRNLFPWDDFRNKHGETISWNNCRVYHSWTYSIFDINPRICKWMSEDDKILEEMFYILERLFIEIWESLSLSFFCESWFTDEDFGKRIINRCNKFQELFRGKLWEEKFMEMYKNIIGWTYGIHLYNNFLNNLGFIQSIFKKNPYAFQDFIWESSKLRRRRIKFLTRELYEIVKGQVVSSLGNK